MSMLVLSRKLCQKIVVPHCQLSVAIIGIQGNAVRLGISAPPEVAVHREELWREIDADRSDVAEADATPDLLDAYAAELSDAACQIALRHGLTESWIDLELGLWRAMATKVKSWSRRITNTLPRSGSEARDAQLARLPR
jgi:carbon storage regulator